MGRVRSVPLPGYGCCVLLKDVHCGTSIEEVDTYQSEDDESGTSHKHKSKLHCCILLTTGTPVTDKKVHRDKGYLIEHEHREEVDADEETIYSGGEQCEPHEELLGQRLELPRSECSGEHDDA